MPAIDSQDLRLAELFRDFYAVPNYQREYVWREDQVEQLLNDIRTEQSDGSQAEYFIGSIVTCPSPRGKFDLIDGQQRMTTLFVILCAIRDRLEFLGDKNTSVIRRLIAEESTDDWGNDVFQPRLEPQYEDAGDVFVKLIDGKKPSKSANTRSMRNVANAYYSALAFLTNEFGENPAELRTFYGYLINKVKLIRINTDSIARALKIFETMNDRGVGLDAMDLLKNLLFMRAPTEQFDALKNEWKILTDKLYQAGEKPLRFLRYFIFASFGVTKLREDELYSWLSDHEQEVGFGRQPILFVQQLNNALDAYLNFLKGNDPRGRAHPAVESLALLAGKSTRQHLILLLAARNLPAEIFSAVCRDTEKLVFFYLVTRQTSREFEVLFPEWALRIGSLSSIEEYRSLSDETFRRRRDELLPRFLREYSALDGRALKQFQLRYILAKLTQYVDLLAYGAKSEAHRWLSRYCDGNTTHIEHVLPQKTTPLVQSEFGQSADDPGRIWSIGNLALAERSINTSLGNAAFSHKRTIYPKSQYLLTRSLSELPEIGNTAIDKALDGFRPFSEWNTSNIGLRQQMLMALAGRVWDFRIESSEVSTPSPTNIYSELDDLPPSPNLKLPPIFGDERIVSETPRIRVRGIPAEGTKGRLIGDAVMEVLRHAGRPLNNPELYEAVRAMGVEVGGQKPSQNLGAHLYNDPRFERVELGWRLVELPVQTSSSAETTLPE
jgi:hypothetical protein